MAGTSSAKTRFALLPGPYGLLRRKGSLRGQIPVHHRPAPYAQLGPLLHHARRDRGNVGDFGTAQAERVAAAHCCASALKAKLALDDSAEQETAKASTKPARRIVPVRDAVIFGSHGPARRGALLTGGHFLSRISLT